MAFFGLRANRWAALACGATLALGCSKVIGISDYEIDPSLDPGAGGEPESNGGKAGSQNPSGGEPSAGGDLNGGGEPNAGTSQGGTPESLGGAGAGGTGAEPECRVTADCNDGIDCTTDACDPSGTCIHTAKDTLCNPTFCETCQLGVGCVPGTATVTQLLLDPAFDMAGTDWDESGSDVPNLITDALAQTPPRDAKFGPLASMGMKQQYSDLYQQVTIPDGTLALNIKGYYKLKPGTKMPADDFLLIAFYEVGAVTAYAQFNKFIAKGDTQAAWKAFDYSIPTATVKKMVGNDYTFDLVAYTWDSVFHVDSLELNALGCQ